MEDDLITPNYTAWCMGGGVECQGLLTPFLSLSLSLASLSRLSLAGTATDGTAGLLAFREEASTVQQVQKPHTRNPKPYFLHPKP